MIISFSNNFDALGLDHATNLVDEVRSPFLSLFEPGAGDTEREFEIGIFGDVLLEEVEHRAITLIGDFIEDALIGLTSVVLVFEIIMVVTNIKNRVFAITNWLMNV